MSTEAKKLVLQEHRLFNTPGSSRVIFDTIERMPEECRAIAMTCVMQMHNYIAKAFQEDRLIKEEESDV